LTAGTMAVTELLIPIAMTALDLSS